LCIYIALLSAIPSTPGPACAATLSASPDTMVYRDPATAPRA
jgi:hypothetical protein